MLHRKRGVFSNVFKGKCWNKAGILRWAWCNMQLQKWDRSFVYPLLRDITHYLWLSLKEKLTIVPSHQTWKKSCTCCAYFYILSYTWHDQKQGYILKMLISAWWNLLRWTPSEPIMGKQVSPENNSEWESGAPGFFSLSTTEWGRRLNLVRQPSVTTLSHVKFERCVLKVQVTVRLLFSSCQRQMFELSLQGNAAWLLLLQKFCNIVPFREGGCDVFLWWYAIGAIII